MGSVYNAPVFECDQFFPEGTERCVKYIGVGVKFYFKNLCSLLELLRKTKNKTKAPSPCSFLLLFLLLLLLTINNIDKQKRSFLVPVIEGRQP